MRPSTSSTTRTLGAARLTTFCAMTSVEAQRGERRVLDDLEHLGAPHVALARHDQRDDRVAAAELAPDRLVDLDQRVIRRQAGLDVELGAQLGACPRPIHTVASATAEQHQPGAADEKAGV